MPRPSPLRSCRRAFPYSPPFIALRKRRSTIRPYPSGGHRFVGPAWASDLNRLRKNSEISSVSRLSKVVGLSQRIATLPPRDGTLREEGKAHGGQISCHGGRGAGCDLQR